MVGEAKARQSATEAFERQREAAVLRRRLEDALDSSEIGLWEWNLETGSFWRSETQRYNLAQPDASALQSFADWTHTLHPDDLQLQAVALREHVAHRTPYYETELRIKKLTGEWEWFLARGRVLEWDEHDAPKIVAGTVLNIMARKQAEADQQLVTDLRDELDVLVEPQQMIASTLRYLASGLDVDVIAHVTFNEAGDGHAVATLLDAREGPQRRPLDVPVDGRGITAAEHSGMTTIRKETAREEASAATPIHDAADQLGCRAFVAVPLTRSGTIPDSVIAGRMDEEDLTDRQVNLAKALCGCFADANSRAKAEQARKRAEEEAQRLMRFGAMSALASTLAHELNQPLATTANFLSVAQIEVDRGLAEASPLLAMAIDKANSQVLRVGALIHRMRDFAMTGEAKLELASILDALQVALEACKTLPIAENVRFERMMPIQLPDLRLDKIQIVQVFHNLLRNAIEAAKDAEQPQVCIEVDVNEVAVEVTVSDNGNGLSADAQAGLFLPFKSIKHDGMGLGLTVCKTIVESHGGRLMGANRAPKGASFKVSLPRADVPHMAL
ncbi:GHKL domain-containing protein [Chakrabartia godavariana]|nr:GHKL domain-containing protein [Chakrabartia godavariana]